MAPGSRKRSLALSLALGWLLASAALAAAADTEEPQGDYSCKDISKVPKHQQCSFIRTKCPSESVVPYAEWYFCKVAPHNVLLRAMYIAAACSLLPLAFCLLGDTAEFYIAPIMAHVSQAIPKMRPRFAGVTFVALGNGAPDLSANIAAISAGEVVLSAGAFTGAAMFVQCVVAAELIALAGDSGIKCGGAMLRDVGVYCLAILSVLLAFSLGQISQAFVGWAIALYVVYMIWVFAGDEWHQRGRPKPQLDAQSFKALLTRIASRGALSSDAAGAAGGAPRRSSAGAPVGYASRDELEESLLPWVVAEDEEANDSYQLPSPGLRGNSGTSRPPPEFEAQLPSPGAFGPQGLRHSAGGGPWGGANGALGSRPGSFTSQTGQQRSTELSAAAPGGFRTPQAVHASSMPVTGSSRRVSAPSLAGAGAGSSGGSAGTGELPSGMQRHSSASAALPPNMQPRGGLPTHQQQQPQQQFGGFAARQAGVVQPHLMSLGRQSFIDPKTYKQLVWADLADDEEEEARLERAIARQLLGAAAAAGRGRGTTTAGAGSYLPPSVSSATASPRGYAPDQQQQGLSPAVASTPRTPAGPSTSATAAAAAEEGAYLSPFGSEGVRTGPNTPLAAEASTPGAVGSPEPGGWSPVAKGPVQGWSSPRLGQPGSFPAEAGQQLYQQQQQLEAVPEGDGGGATVGGGDTWQQLQWQVTLGNSEEWADAGPVRQLFRKVTFPLLLPAYLGQRLTIPFASASGYSREWLISSLLCFPLALIAYLGLVNLPGVLIACGVGIGAAVLGAVLTAWDEPGQMAVQGLGGRAAAAVPGVLAVLAFCMGVVWIDTIATEVVGIITFLAGLASLPSGVMGLTLLAWGNSLGDYFGNRAMAKAGHTSTAITACFAAPLFNMLISLACGFSSYLHKLGVTSVKVTLTPEVALGCVFLVGYNIAIISVGRLCGWRLPPWFRHFARAWYALYFTLAVASGFYLSWY